MVRHGRKEQFSITLDIDLADKIHAVKEDLNHLYMNQTFDHLIKKAFLYIDLMENYEKNQKVLFKRGFDMAADIAQFSKHKAIKKALKLHYDTLEELYQDTKNNFNIP